MEARIYTNQADVVEFITNTKRPRFKDNKTQLAVNSFLLKREWEVLDAAVVRASRERLNIIADLRRAGLVTETNLGEMVSTWRVGSQRRRPDVTMDGRTNIDRDRTERKTASSPLPIIATAYEIARRELLASRRLGTALDTYEAEEAARAVVEETERLVLDGNSDIVVSGSQIYGMANHPDRLTDTASNYGGGDFGTEGNPVASVLGGISALSAINYFGPFGIWVAGPQYNELLAYYTDGSGDTELMRIERLPMVEFVHPADLISDGELIISSLTSDVIDIREASGVDNREWEHPNGSAMIFEVMAAMTPRLKSDYKGNLGVLHMTGC